MNSKSTMKNTSNKNQWLEYYHDQISFTLLFLVSFSAWLWTNGLVIELPFFVPFLPEGAKLGSFMSLANGLSSFSLFLIPSISKLGLERACYLTYFLGLLLSFSIIFLWDKTIDHSFNVFPHGISLGFLLNSWLLLSLDTIRITVLYTMVGKRFPPYFMTTVLLGTTCSGFFETLLSFIQSWGLEDENLIKEECSNKKLSHSARKSETFHKLTTDFVFGPTAALVIYFSVFLSSCLAFVALSKFDQNRPKREIFEHISSTVDFKEVPQKEIHDEKGKLLAEEHRKNTDDKLPQSSKKDTKSGSLKLASVFDSIFEEFDGRNNQKYFLWAIWLLSSATIYNFMSPFFTYTTIPYSQRSYHLSVTLWGLCLPLTTLVAHCIPAKRMVTLMSIMMTHFAVCSILLYIASQSPEPPLYCESSAGIVVVVLWMIHATTGYYTFASSCYRLNEMDSKNPGALLWGTYAAQFGDILGAFLSFILVNFTHFLV